MSETCLKVNRISLDHRDGRAFVALGLSNHPGEPVPATCLHYSSAVLVLRPRPDSSLEESLSEMRIDGMADWVKVTGDALGIAACLDR